MRPPLLLTFAPVAFLGDLSNAAQPNVLFIFFDDLTPLTAAIAKCAGLHKTQAAKP